MGLNDISTSKPQDLLLCNHHELEWSLVNNGAVFCCSFRQVIVM
jgi:hypothetical protein